MTPRLVALIKRVVKLRKVDLKACHCAEEFTLRQIHLPRPPGETGLHLPVAS
jgi:hypothetical protein